MNDVRRVQVVQHQYPRRGQASRPRCRAMHAAVPTIMLRRAARAGAAVGNWGERGRRSGHHTHTEGSGLEMGFEMCSIRQLVWWRLAQLARRASAHSPGYDRRVLQWELEV